MSPIEQRKAWARRFITAAPDAPSYGTDAWLALPDGPEKVAAVVRAAECWQTDFEETLQRIEAARKAAEDAAYVARRDRHRDEYSRKSWRPHPANRRDVA